MSDMTRREQRVRERAHQLWQQAGEPEGKDEQFWHEAEAQIEAEDRAKENQTPQPSPGGRDR
jgi:hypothetical protein